MFGYSRSGDEDQIPHLGGDTRQRGLPETGQSHHGHHMQANAQQFRQSVQGQGDQRQRQQCAERESGVDFQRDAQGVWRRTRKDRAEFVESDVPALSVPDAFRRGDATGGLEYALFGSRFCVLRCFVVS